MHWKKSFFLSCVRAGEAWSDSVTYLSIPVLPAREFSSGCCITATRAIYALFIATSAGPSPPICEMNGVLGSLLFVLTEYHR